MTIRKSEGELSKPARLFVCSTHPGHAPMTASEFEEHRAEQEREDSEEGYLQLGDVGTLMGRDPASESPSKKTTKTRTTSGLEQLLSINSLTITLAIWPRKSIRKFGFELANLFCDGRHVILKGCKIH